MTRSRGRLLSHKASDPMIAELQRAIGSKPAKPFPKRKEKRLINGKWTRDYDETASQGESQRGVPQVNVAAQMMAETPPPSPTQLTPAQQRMREVAERLRKQKEQQ